MALRRLALGTILAAFPGRSAPAWALDLLTEGLAGFTLFGGNIGAPEEVAALTAGLRAARPGILVATDEEGGDVTRLAHRTGSPYPGNAALGVVDDPELTRAVYAAIGADLTAAGVNLNLAPVVDVNTADDNPVIGTRAFGADPLLVARHARAAVAGLQSTGVAACAKHFPGHGATVADSHRELPTVEASLDLLRTRDLPPFVAAGSRAVMTAHIRVPALTGAGPATFSRRALHELLRGELGFRGVIVTDALEMRGVGVSVPEAAVRALTAGADLLCLGARVNRELTEAVATAIETAVRDGRLRADRLAEAAARNTELATPPAAAQEPVVGDLGLGLAGARRAVHVEGSPAALAGPLVVRLVSRRSAAEGGVPWGLAAHLGRVEQIDVVAGEASADALVARAGDRPIVVVGRRVHRSAESRALLEDLAAAHPVGVVEMGWPSAWRPAQVRAFVVTYGASLANGLAAAELLRG